MVLVYLYRNISHNTSSMVTNEEVLFAV